jgi:hypothetical protein
VNSSSRGAAHVDLQHEPVFLRLRQRIGALVFDGILRGEDREIGRQGVGVTVNGDQALLHGLKQGRLGFGGRAVDLIGQQEIGEHRPLDQRELVALEVEDVGAGDVGRHQVRGELDARKTAAQGGGDGPHQQRFGDSRHAFHQGMMPGKDGDQREVNHPGLADDDFANFRPHLGEDCFQTIRSFVHNFRVPILPATNDLSPAICASRR